MFLGEYWSSCFWELLCMNVNRKKSTEVFIRDALETRLRMLIPYLSKWPQVNTCSICRWAHTTLLHFVGWHYEKGDIRSSLKWQCLYSPKCPGSFDVLLITKLSNSLWGDVPWAPYCQEIGLGFKSPCCGFETRDIFFSHHIAPVHSAV